MKTLEMGNVSIKLSGRAGDPYYESMSLEGHANDFLTYCINKYMSRDAIVFDVGANIGLTAVLLAQAVVEGQVTAFEPDKETFSHLQQTIQANGLTNCSTMQCAIGRSSGQAGFFVNPDSASASHLAFDGVSLGETNAMVSVKTLDELASGLTRLDFIKIDVEGFELDVLMGAKNTLNRLKPHVFLEFNSFTLIAYGNQNPRSVLEHLKLTFPHVYCFQDKTVEELTGYGSILGFLHRNLTQHGCVDDLLCTFEPLK